jgi:hypothetical protein
VDLAVHDHVDDVHPLRPELACHGLRERVQAELADGERREAGRTAQGGGGPRQKDRAASRLDHRRKHLLGGVEGRNVLHTNN